LLLFTKCEFGSGAVIASRLSERRVLPRIADQSRRAAARSIADAGSSSQACSLLGGDNNLFVILVLNK
jgi:hypothetical protein